MKLNTPGFSAPLESAADMEETILKASREETECSGLIFSGQSAAEASFSGVDFRRCRFSGCRFSDCRAERLSFIDAVFVSGGQPVPPR